MRGIASAHTGSDTADTEPDAGANTKPDGGADGCANAGHACTDAANAQPVACADATNRSTHALPHSSRVPHFARGWVAPR